MDNLKTELFEKAKLRGEKLYSLYLSLDDSPNKKEFKDLPEKTRDIWINIGLGKFKPDPEEEKIRAEKDKKRAEAKLKKLDNTKKDKNIKELSTKFKI